MAVLVSTTAPAAQGSASLAVPSSAYGAATLKIKSLSYPAIEAQRNVEIIPMANISYLAICAPENGMPLSGVTEGEYVHIRWNYVGNPNFNLKLMLFKDTGISEYIYPDLVIAEYVSVLNTVMVMGVPEYGYSWQIPENINDADFIIVAQVVEKPGVAVATRIYPLTITRSFPSFNAPGSVEAGSNFEASWTVDDINGNVQLELIQ